MNARRILERYVAGLRKRRQIAGREEIRTGNAKRGAQFGWTFRTVSQLLQQIVRHLVAALLQNVRHVNENVEVVAHDAIRQHPHPGKSRNAPQPLDEPRLLLVIQEERAAGNAADQMTALVGLEVA